MTILLTDRKPDIKRAVVNSPSIYYKLFWSFKGLNLNDFFAGVLADSFFLNSDAHDIPPT